MFTLCVYQALHYLLHDSLLPLLHTQHLSPPVYSYKVKLPCSRGTTAILSFLPSSFCLFIHWVTLPSMLSLCPCVCVCVWGGILGVSVTWEIPLSHHYCHRVLWGCRDFFAVRKEKAVSQTSLSLLNKLFFYGDPIVQYGKKALLSKRASQVPPAVRYCLDYTLWWAPLWQKGHTYLWSCTGGAIKHEKPSATSADGVEKEGGWEMKKCTGEVLWVFPWQLLLHHQEINGSVLALILNIAYNECEWGMDIGDVISLSHHPQTPLARLYRY